MAYDITFFLAFTAALGLGGFALGPYMARVFSGERTWLTPIVGPIERGLLAAAGVKPGVEQRWTAYAASLVLFNTFGFLLLFGMLSFQHLLPLNPQGFDGLSWHLAFNTAVSFVTNTNWQSYGGETTMSHFSQMAGLTVHNFLSAATGIAVAVAVTRGIAARSAQSVGDFWTDLVRAVLYLLLPGSFLFAIVLMWQGIPQTLQPSVDATTLEGVKQTIAIGPVASQVAIKMLGTNGGGFFNANAAHPFENPTGLSNLLQIYALLIIPAAFPFFYGRMVRDVRQGYAIYAAMTALFLIVLFSAYFAELAGNPLTAQSAGPGVSMEGKEVRFGLAQSVLFVVATTVASCGAVNAMHDSLTALGGLVPMFNMLVGEVIYGGVGAGFYGMLLFVVLTVFLAGLMVGRTPEYLGKKIEAKEVKLAALTLLIMPVGVLGFAAVAIATGHAQTSVQDAGPHGLSELIYAYISATANNGSAFAGFTANTPFHNVMLGLAMILGRFGYILPILAIAGSLAAKHPAAATAGSFPTHGTVFVVLLAVTIVIVGALTFLPILALGPIAEHVSMLAGQRF